MCLVILRRVSVFTMSAGHSFARMARVSDSTDLQANSVFAGRYRIERRLKSGGMGAVYVVRHIKTEAMLALKVMRPEIVQDPTARARFTQEARVASLIESACVVSVTDADVDEVTGIPFLVMEFLRGKELGELLEERGRFSPSEVIGWLAQTARALDKAHAKGIVHRDLKPENLFLVMSDDEPPKVKILDFGIAKIIQSATQHTTQGGGTPLYMAPEQTSKGRQIGPWTDVWALGLIAYALIVGRPYWEATALYELFGEILRPEREAPTARAAKVGVSLPPAFDAWFIRATAHEPTHRFASAGEAVQALAHAFGVAAPIPAPSAVDLPAAPPPALGTMPMPQPSAVATAPMPSPPLAGPPVVAASTGAPVASSHPSAPHEEPPLTLPGAKSRAPLIVGAAVLLAAATGVIVYATRSRDDKSGSKASAPVDSPTSQPKPTEKPDEAKTISANAPLEGETVKTSEAPTPPAEPTKPPAPTLAVTTPPPTPKPAATKPAETTTATTKPTATIPPAGTGTPGDCPSWKGNYSDALRSKDYDCVRTILMPRLNSGAISSGEARYLKAACAALGDSACVKRAGEKI